MNRSVIVFSQGIKQMNGSSTLQEKNAEVEANEKCHTSTVSSVTFSVQESRPHTLRSKGQGWAKQKIAGGAQRPVGPAIKGHLVPALAGRWLTWMSPRCHFPPIVQSSKSQFVAIEDVNFTSVRRSLTWTLRTNWTLFFLWHVNTLRDETWAR